MLTSFLRVDAPRALRAVRALVADPDDLPQVFALIEVLSGDTLARLARRMEKHAEGRRILATRPDIVSMLQDREALRRMPEGSLARTYLDFLESEGISAEGIRDAQARGQHGTKPLSPEQRYLSDRLRDTHDLWHAVTGYRGDVLGESALLAFTLAQTWNPGIAVILAVGLWKTLGAPAARAVIIDGFRRGRRAAWLPAVAWEELLQQPIGEIRARLSVSAPPTYTPIRSAELKAAMAPAA